MSAQVLAVPPLHNPKAFDENASLLFVPGPLAECQRAARTSAASSARLFRLVSGLSACAVGQAFGAICPEYYENPDNRECLNTINESLIALTASTSMLIFAVIMVVFIAGLLFGFKTSSVRHQYGGDL